MTLTRFYNGALDWQQVNRYVRQEMMRQESRLYAKLISNHKILRLHTDTWTPVENQENAAGIQITRI